MKASVYRILALTLALAMLIGILPSAAAEDRSMHEIVLFNSDFERGDDSYWDVSGVSYNSVKRNLQNEHNNTYFLDLRPNDPDDRQFHAAYTVELEPGTYYFTFNLSGDNIDPNSYVEKGESDQRNLFPGLDWYIRAGDILLAQSIGGITTYGKDFWTLEQTESFTINAPMEITFDYGGSLGTYVYSARLDNLRLYGDGGLAFEPYLDWITLEGGDFETGNGAWSLTGLTGEIIQNSSSSWDDSKVLNLWVSDTQPADISLSYTVTLTEGYYNFAFQMDGANADSGLSWSVTAGDQTLCQGGTLVTNGWDNWQEYTTDQFVLNRTTEVTFTLSGTLPAGYWAHLDEVRLDGTGVVFLELQEIELPNSDFEMGDGSHWDMDHYDDGNVSVNTGSNVNDSYVLNLWKGNSDDLFVNIVYAVTLTPGTYQISFDLEGEEAPTTLQGIVENSGICYMETDYLETYGWDEWTTYESYPFEIFETATVRFWLTGDIPANYWGHLDNLRLYGTGEVYGGLPPMETDDGNFDYGGSYWSINGFSDPDFNYDSSVNSSYMLPLGISEEEAVEASASYLMHLLPGTYSMSFDMEGKEGMSGLHAVLTGLGAEHPESGAVLREGGMPLYDSGELETHGFDQWETHNTDEFTLSQPGWVRFELCGTVPAGYWGHFDNLKLWGDGSFYPSHFDHDPTLAVPKVQGVDDYDFVRGTDVSSYLSLINAGAEFFDYEGNLLDEEGFFQLLSRAGFNYVRIRVWVDPYDALGRGYGGGNNDLETAKYLSRLATNAGLRVMIDFHYSDFWADPGKQQAPKAWANYSLQQKADAIEEYTYNSLKAIKQWSNDGYMVDMVQIGNETTSGVCGESNWANMAQLFAAGARAVRRLDEERMEDTKVTIHFTNPERSSTIKGFADRLNQYQVDYDVFATSWYPYWHGSTDNLTSVLSYVANTYGKEVLVAETSWAWTLADGDGHDNTVRVGSNDSGNAYPFTQQGQADELVAATRAVTAVGEKGLGVFYWENAWIPVQYAYDENGSLDQDILASNQQAWETYGCGWASSYAGEYQNDAAQWHGGSAVDNQAMFDFHGQALDSLWTWYYMMFGTEELFGKQVEDIETVELELNIGDSFTLPETVRVTYNVDGSKQEPVAWNAEDLAAVDVNTPGVYTVRGTVTLSYSLGTAEITATITVNHPNLLLNFDFESSNLSMYTFSGSHDWSTDTPHGGSHCLHFYNGSASSLDFSQNVTLQPGEYSFSLFAQGDAKGGTAQYIYVSLAGETLTEDFALAGWAVWQHPELRFTVTQETAVTVGAHIAYGAGGWGTFDDLNLRLTAEAEPVPTEPIETSNLRIFSSISVGTDMVVTYSARKQDLTDYVKFWIEVVKHTPEGDVAYSYGADQPEALNEGNTAWQADFKHLFAKEMGIDVEARLYAQDAAGQIYMSPAKITNIRDYLGGRLTATNNTVQQRVLAADMLNYGAAAQMFMNYETDHLVNVELTSDQLAKLRQYETKTLPAVNKTNSNYRPEGASNILFNSVSLDNEVVLNLTVRANQGDTVKVLMKDHDTGTVLETLDAAWNGSNFTVEYRGIGADKMRVAYDFTAQVNDAETGNTRTWSIEGYVGEIRSGSNQIKTNMANALLTYGDSAAAYFAAQ